MGFTMRELISTIDSACVLAGEEGLDKEFSLISYFDAPDEDRFLKGGEFLLTTGYIFQGQFNQLREFIIRIQRAGAVGLGIKLRYIDYVPEEIIKIAQDLDFLLISFTEEFTNAILYRTLNEICFKKSSMLALLAKFYDGLSKILLNEGDIKQILDYISEYTTSSVCYCDVYLNALYTSGLNKSFFTDVNTLTLEAILEKFENYSIEIGNKFYGYLIFEDLDPIFEECRMIDHIKVALNLCIKKKVNDRDRYIYDIIFNKLNTFSDVEIREIMASFNFDQEKRTFVIVVEMPLEIIKSLRNSFLVREALKIINLYFSNVVYYNLNTCIVFIAQTEQHKVFRDELNKALQTIDSEIISKHDLMIKIGIGQTKNSLRDISQSYQEALSALEVGKKVNRNQMIFFYDDLGIYQILSGLQKEEALRFINLYLGNLLEYDEDNVLLNTLESLVNHGWNMTKVSQELYIHYSTIKYRYSRLSELLNHDLNDPDQRLNVSLALKLLKMING